MYATARDACKHFNISYKTLYRWTLSGKIKYITLKSGQRRYIIEQNFEDNTKKTYIYTRVSSKKQADDLQRQIKFISTKLSNEKQSNIEIISDIASAFNFERKGFRKILKEVFNRNVNKVYVTYPDRFSRLSYNFFEWLFEYFGAELISINKASISNKEYEFAEDIIGIITHYSAKYYGKRKYLSLK